ncbi:MAG: hypothetical protein NC318_11630 [Blautia sp.]|nr:hypothetical protein [Blautia sp.]
MNISSLIDFCKQNYPERTIDLCEALDLIIDTLTNLKSDLGKSMPTLIDNDDYDAIDEYKNHAKTVAQIIQNLNNISNDITIDNLEDDEQIVEALEPNNIDINYNDKSFNADSNIPHTLYEDFTYTKPAGIEIENTYLEANEWRDVFNKCCQYLLNKDADIFSSFLSDTTMQGRKCKYFSYDSSELREGVRVKGSKIYIEYNVNATFVRNIIIKMLEKYEIPKRSCHIFIRRDLTSLHSDNAKLQEAAQKLEESNNEIKIGQYAKEYFVSYFQSHTSESDINKFTDKKWCHDTFGICYPILKQVDIKLPINEQVNYNNQYRRYYSSPVLKINEKNYIICSQWFAQFKPKLINWINSNSVSIEINKNNGILEIGDKLKFNKNFNSISIPKILFVDILKSISDYGNRPFETGYLAERFSVRILRESGYEKPHHIINNIRKYLESENCISLYADSKKGKYIVSDSDKLQSIIQKYSTEDNIVENNISVKQEVIVYSYHDKKQIVSDLNNPNDEYSFLHNYCTNKKAGYRFSVNSKEYVIVSFKKKQRVKIDSEG